MARWHSFDSHDWCFSGPGFVGTAFLLNDKAHDNSPSHILIDGFAGKFGPDHLHRMLWLTRAQFPNLEFRCRYSGNLFDHLNDLSRRGFVNFENLSLGLVKILSISEPTSGRPYIDHFHERFLSRLVSVFRKTIRY